MKKRLNIPRKVYDRIYDKVRGYKKSIVRKLSDRYDWSFTNTRAFDPHEPLFQKINSIDNAIFDQLINYKFKIK